MSLVFQFCCILGDFLMRPELQDCGIVLYTSTRPHQKANAAALLALRMLLVEKKTPAEVLHPFATLELEPFRDSGYGRADYGLSLQDVVYGAWRATAQNLLFDIETFDLDEYLYSERTVNGDWSWITPNIIAFASPDDPRFRKAVRLGLVGVGEELDEMYDYSTIVPGTPAERKAFALWDEQRPRLLSHLTSRNVKLIVRLNEALYDARMFTEAGIEHLDLYFEDGSNPSELIMRTFLHHIQRTIDAGFVVAVHCKAGLGRTGVLIGTHLIHNWGFSASEAIAWMRLMRPGCVVGPQQHFLHNKAPTIVQWAERERDKATEVYLRKDRKRLQERVKSLEAQLHQVQAQLDLHEESPTKRRSTTLSPRSPNTSPTSPCSPLSARRTSVPVSGDAVARVPASDTRPITSTSTARRTSTFSTVGSPPERHVSVHTGPFISPPNKLPVPTVGQPRKSRRSVPNSTSTAPVSPNPHSFTGSPSIQSEESVVPRTPISPGLNSPSRTACPSTTSPTMQFWHEDPTLRPDDSPLNSTSSPLSQLFARPSPPWHSSTLPSRSISSAIRTKEDDKSRTVVRSRVRAASSSEQDKGFTVMGRSSAPPALDTIQPTTSGPTASTHQRS